LLAQQAESNRQEAAKDRAHIYELFQSQSYQKSKSKAAMRKKVMEDRYQSLNYDRLYAKGVTLDPDTGLPLGIGYDELVSQIKREYALQGNDKYLKGLTALVHELNLKNEAELVRLFKRALVMLRADDIRARLQGEILKAGVEMATHTKEHLLEQAAKEALR
jgi:hypothetical protein